MIEESAFATVGLPQILRSALIATCFFQIDLPTGYPSYEIFKGKLELSLTVAAGGDGFQFD